MADLKRLRASPGRKRLLGTHERMGLLPKTLLYVMLASIGFVYLYPILHMAVTSLKSLTDLLNPAVKWIPNTLTMDNYAKALEVMGFSSHLGDTLLVSLLPSLAQVASCALAGYAFARFRFKLRGLWLACVLITFIVPFPVLMVPTYTLYADYGMLGSLWTLLLPALTGQGLRSAIFVLIFMAFFSQTPRSLDEAARVDGSGETRVFLTIAVPLAVPALITSFLFSFVWYWNETYLTSLYMGNAKLGDARSISTLVMELEKFEDSYKIYLQRIGGWAAGGSVTSIQNEAVTMAGSVLVILPLLLVYFCLQRHFTEAIDRSGITGE